ncbi:RluA family pseudouridine synthase [Amphibacillus sp. MSJ-3]|uniref:RluA family pseudouridine synthase n=1 Tax=Amphibacillus sp. MSJ-3 TaxID=2841505 RepID=UPI001C0EDBD5|nr:RluA family pseudouridine synthase [Amphibacillus sp. MSJ-3]MBU5594626.1 RluA family pseudouridine synthase [Amphibacillus sp. MSJ-3]
MTYNEHVIDSANENIRIDKLLSKLLTDSSRAQIQNWIKAGLVKVNGKIVKANYRCQTGQIVTWEEPEVEEIQIEPESLNLDIIYEDNDIIIVNKRKGMVVHPASGHRSGTLVNGLLFHTEHLSKVNGEIRPGIVHRIDRDTSGLLIVAKNDQAHLALADQLKQRKVKRSYLALVHGAIPHEYGTIKAPIGRNPKDRQSMSVVSNGKEAVTHFEVIERINQKFTLIRCKLETGRTHQIRVHMKYIGFPIVGDPKYGQRKSIKGDGQALHAEALAFQHPQTKEWLEFKVDPPASFNHYLAKARESY